MRQKLLLMMVGVLACTVLCAQKVTEQEALTKAQQFMQGKQLVTKSSPRRIKSVAQAPQNRSYYVFNVEQNEGFVIVSGDERTPDILGYSERGNLDPATAPCNVRWLLSYYEAAIGSLTEYNTTAINRASDHTAISPMLATTWGQGNPYYNQCPTIDGQPCATGCVATAMAQVMNFHQWPKGETSEIPAYTTTTNSIYLPKLDATTFPWDNMTEDDIARLMSYCGQAVGMDYDPTESGAYDVRIPGALVAKFGYDNGTRIVYRNGYNSERWNQLMYDELAAGRPVIYGGQSNSGGHSFILHGYEDGRFYINWGWDGMYDGYFELTDLNPDYDANRAFNRNQTAVIGIQPSTGGSAKETPKVTVTNLSLTSETSLNRNSSAEDFPAVSVSSELQHAFAEATAIQVGFALYQGSTFVKTLVSKQASLMPGSPITYESSFSFGSGLDDGTYRIVPAYREDDTKDWVADEGIDFRYIEATITGSNLTLKEFPDATHDERLKFEIIDDNHVSVLPANLSIDGDIVIPPAVLIENKEYIVSEFAFRGFEGCKFITSISLPSTMNMNQYGVFDGCESLNSIYVEPGNSMLYSEEGVLFFKHPNYESGVILYCYPAGKKGETYNVSSDVVDIGDWAFSGNNSLKSVSLPPTVTLIGQYSFANCSLLESINFPEGLSRISYNAFMGTSLNEIVLPQSLSTLSGWAFDNCIALTAVTSKHATPLNISEDTFSPSTYENATLYVPKGRLSYYQAAIGWGKFSTIIEKEFEDVAISDDPFDNLSDNQMILGFYAKDSSAGTRFGGVNPGLYKAGLKFTKSRISPFAGNKITHVRFSIADANISDVKLWFSSSLNDEYLYSQVVENVKTGWNVIKLDKPFEITADSICIGYEFVLSGAGYPIHVTWGIDVENNAEGSGYIYGPYNADGSSSWDYMYFMNDSKAAVCLQAIVEGELLPAYDMRPVELNGLRQCYGENRAEGWCWSIVKNCGKKAINDAVIGFQIDEETPSFIHYTKGLSSQACDEGGTIQFTFGDGLKVGRHQAKVYISEINGLEPMYTKDDTLSLSFVVVGDTLPKQKYLYEHFTATWCSYSANNLYENLDAATVKRDDISLVRIHVNDELSCDAGTELSVLQSFLPAYCVDRGAYVGDTYINGAQGLFYDFPESEYIKGIPAVADISIEANYSPNDFVTITISGRKTSDYSLLGEKACLNVMLTEDGLLSTQASDNGYIEGFTNNKVLRACLSDVWGDAIDWNGDKFTKTYTINIKNTWKRENMHVVAFIANPFTGHNYDDLHVINCNDFDLKDAELIESPVIPGDVTGTGEVDVQDATIVVNYILGESSDGYDYSAADVNGDGEVDVFDVTKMIDIILNDSPAATSRRNMNYDGTKESITLTSTGGDIVVGLEQASRYTSFQFDVEVPDGADLQSIQWAGNNGSHNLQFEKTGQNRYRVLALSMESQPLSAIGTNLLQLRFSDGISGHLGFENMLFVTPQGEAVHFRDNWANISTGISGVTVDEREQIYDMQGRRLRSVNREQLGKGVYLINNKKVVIK